MGWTVGTHGGYAAYGATSIYAVSPAQSVSGYIGFYSSGQIATLSLEWAEHLFTWYSSATADSGTSQFNRANFTYYYLAIGI